MRTYELHASPKQIQRSAGRSSVAAAAYRSASRLVDERTGLVHDYTRKGGVEHSRVYVPDHAPDWAKNQDQFALRSLLWNASEAKENRGNSMTARELVVAFPAEYNAMQRREAGDVLAQELMRRFGSAVDVSYHKPSMNGDQRNHHAHFMFTTRGFDRNTKDGWARTKYRDLNKDPVTLADGSKTVRSSITMLELRAFIAGEMNRIAERDNLNVRTEHLSFEERGIEREPTQHLGPTANEMEREGKPSDRGDINRKIKASNDNIRSLEDQRRAIILEQERVLQDIAHAQLKKKIEKLKIPRYERLKAAKEEWRDLKVAQTEEKATLKKRLKEEDSVKQRAHRKRWNKIIAEERKKQKDIVDILAEKGVRAFLFRLRYKNDLEKQYGLLEKNIKSHKAQRDAGVGHLSQWDEKRIRQLNKTHYEQGCALRQKIDQDLVEIEKERKTAEDKLLRQAEINPSQALVLQNEFEGKTKQSRDVAAKVERIAQDYQQEQEEKATKDKEQTQKDRDKVANDNKILADKPSLEQPPEPENKMFAWMDKDDRLRWLFDEKASDQDKEIDHDFEPEP